ncbi:DUF4153 domain-containing protein [Nitratireductor sp. GISD-1A_MAKvit]|uniref:DUF4153 domain-containing protein n=1 Tax=Nitratireductor sp. GISD-1A_MAKvit TaxID=3234198 RepID=UPI0034660CAA
MLPVLAGLAGFAVMWPDPTSYTVEWALLLSLVALVPLAPFAGRGTGAAFWMFTARLAFATALALLALVLFGGGISAILASLSLLFGLEIPDDLYAHIWLSIGFFIAPLFGLGQTPVTFEEEPVGQENDVMQLGMRALGDFAAVPLLIIYSVILHLYVAKIVLTGAVPQGQIGWLVLTYGVCIVAVLLLTKPFLDTARAPTRFFVRYWPLLLLIPLGLLFYALSVRVGDFGWTVQRYFLGLFGVVALVLSILQAVPRIRGDIRLIAGVPVLALLLGSFGPQGAIGWSLSDQRTRFLEIVGNEPEDAQTKGRALSVLQYLDTYGAVLEVAPEGFVPRDDDTPYRQVARAWKLDPDDPEQHGRRYFSYNSAPAGTLPLDGFDTLIQNVALYKENATSDLFTLPDGSSLRLVLKRNAVSVEPVAGGPTLFSIDTARIDALSAKRDDHTVALRLEADGRQIMLIPNYLSASLTPETIVESFSGVVLLRRSDWN